MLQKLRTMSFRELSVFVEIVRHQSMTEAANKLGMAKSAVSQQLSAIEERLEVKLLSRNARTLALTQEGAQLLPQIESILAETGRLFDVSEHQRIAPQGKVRMAGTPDLGAMIIKTLAPKLKLEQPAITLVANFNYQFENLQDPFFDFAVRVGKVSDDNLVARPLGVFRRIVVASPKLLAGKQLGAFEELAEFPSLIFSGANDQSTWHFEHNDTQDTASVEVKGVLAAQSFAVLADLAAQGLGVTCIPDFVAAPLIREGRLSLLFPSWYSRKTEVFLVHRFGAEKINRVKVVTDFMRKEIPSLFDLSKIET